MFFQAYKQTLGMTKCTEESGFFHNSKINAMINLIIFGSLTFTVYLIGTRNPRVGLFCEDYNLATGLAFLDNSSSK